VTVKILVVDDSKAMRMIVTRTLRQAGLGNHTIVEGCDGAEGLALVASESPDLVMSDWNMPNLSGIDFLRALRAQGNDVRFGFVTSESTDAMRATAEQAGALFLIGKPFTAETFAEVLGDVLV
jgi:two-component system chemotaxis response regulator CheY